MTAARPGRVSSAGWSVSQPSWGAHLAIRLRSAFPGGRALCRPRWLWPPVTCWSRAKSSAPARPGGSAGRTARAGPVENPAALPLHSQPAALPPWPPCCYGNDVRRDPEAVASRREGNPRGNTWGSGGEGKCALRFPHR